MGIGKEVKVNSLFTVCGCMGIGKGKLIFPLVIFEEDWNGKRCFFNVFMKSNRIVFMKSTGIHLE